jgi:glutamate--cysteine ligase
MADQRLSRLLNCQQPALLSGGLIGLEKESLRVNRKGGIAQTPHPRVLGSALTNPYVTTDYSEALLEFITPPFAEPAAALKFLRDAQKFVYDRLQDEILWATSMPCVLIGEANIPIAYYGESNAGKMKTVYRRGLGYRYGRVMQVIAGVHFNYSVPDAFWPVFQELEGASGPLQAFINDRYFGMIRNLQRFGWLVSYLFGASPAVCKSFMGGKPTHMPVFNDNTYYEPYATSLRMGDIGYQNRKEDETGVKACYDSLDSYVASLTCAIGTPCPVYEKIGVVVDGEYRQLNANLLQIENEYYSTIRPKQVLNDNEKPSLALKYRGVRYVELRSLDVNAFDPLGISETQLRFLEAFVLFCLLHDSPVVRADERAAIDHNQLEAAHRGRDPALELIVNGATRPLRQWAAELCSAMEGVCDYLDASDPARHYSRALDLQKEAVRDADRTPSARMLAEMRDNGEGFYDFARRISAQHGAYFAKFSAVPESRAVFERAATESLQRQAEMEAADDLPFDQYLARYFAQE